MKEILLTFDGGGSYGAWHLGVLKTLNEKNYIPKRVSASSVGVFAGIAAIYKKEEKTREFFENLDSFATLVPKSDFLLLPWRLFFGGGLFSQKKIEGWLRTLLPEEDFLKEKEAELVVTCVSYKTGRVEYFSNLKVDYNTFISAVLASSALPGIFAPVLIRDEYYFDASTREDIPIEYLKEKDGDLEHIVCVCTPDRIGERSSFGSAVEVFFRAADFSVTESQESDLKIGKLVSENKIKVIRNNTPIMNSGIDYSGNKIKQLIESAYTISKEKL